MAGVEIITVTRDELIEAIRELLREELSVLKTGYNPGPEEILNRKDTSALLKISLPFLQKLTDKGIIPSFKAGRVIRYKKSELLKAIDNKAFIKYQRSNKSL